MKKAVLICIFGVLLSGCANSGQTEDTQTPAVSEAVTTAPKEAVTAPTETTSQKEGSPETTGATADVESTSTSISSESGENDPETTTRKTVTSQTEAVTSVMTEPNISTTVALTESKPSETAVTTAPKIIAKPSSTASTTKKSTSASTKPTAKPSATTTTVKPKQTTTTTKSRQQQFEDEFWEIVERKGLQGQDATCLETMVLNLKYSDTPPSYYESIGKGLKHDGTDYGKAKAVFKWMIANGHGSCVYYSMETYFVCKGIGLECAYAFASNNGWYGHTYSVVKVNGTWYIMDTQGELFLDNNEPCTRMFDGNDNDLKPFKPDIWYDYDENGEYRNWTISD